ncbi:M42 family peptidase [Romboutsia weinsteinii]|uniref:M42 family peptidase n=1 Tax=Romboutsia weinsteinii TaxID=2020949 RepID=A0A371J306_9FIRM|nr:M42 family metallopeptidase [Romboutsia weinsteinii]RDY27115.1 M42 family peptidase [Romboutsia weinsteinii]
MILSENTLSLMEELTQIIGVSGNEKNISKTLQSYYKKYTDEIIYDNLGSIFAVKRSGKPNSKKVMICAHMDEAGFIVHEIKESGLIKILPIGNVFEQALIGKRVRVSTSTGEIKGVIVTKSQSALSSDEKNKSIKSSNMFVDIGATSDKEVKECGIRLGNPIVVDGEFEALLGGKRLVSKAWDNRYGCVLGIEILELLKDTKLDVDLYVGCTVQNEIGLRGCITATNLIAPDMAIVLDCLHSNDINGNEDNTGKLGEGVLVSFYDKSMMPNRTLLNHLIEICETKEIKHQYYYSMDDGDGGWIHKLLEGCPTLKVCICSRNTKTNSSIIDAYDYINAKKSLLEVIKSLDDELITMFKSENR